MCPARGEASPVPPSVPVVLAVIFCDASSQFLVFPFIPFLVRAQLSLPADHPHVPVYCGFLAAAYLFGQFICSPFYGGLSDRLGRRPVILGCVLASSCLLLAFGFSSSYVLSLCLRLLQGASAGALTVGKLYLADVTDPTNEGRVFSLIGIAIGSGCIVGPALGGLLADPSLLAVPRSTPLIGQLIRSYPYLPPCLAGAGITAVVLLVALATLPESSAPKSFKLFPAERGAALSKRGSGILIGGTPQLSTPLLPAAGPGGSGGSGGSGGGRGAGRGGGGFGSSRGSSRAASPVLLHRLGSGSLLEAMTGHASRASLIVTDDDERSCGGATPPVRSSPGRPVCAVSLALRHSLSPSATRADLFSDSLEATPKSVRLLPLRDEASAAAEEQSRRTFFWLVQLSCLIFTLTNVGLTEVMPVWLSTPRSRRAGAGGLGLGPSVIGNLQSITGVGNILLALFVTFRIIRSLGAARTFALALLLNAAAALGPPIVQLLPTSCPGEMETALMCISYSLVAASRNMMFATAVMLSKEAAAGAPGVAIGINQSACSLGAAIGPVLTGLGYTFSLSSLGSCAPFFLALGFLGALPGWLLLAPQRTRP